MKKPLSNFKMFQAATEALSAHLQLQIIDQQSWKNTRRELENRVVFYAKMLYLKRAKEISKYSLHQAESGKKIFKKTSQKYCNDPPEMV